MIDNLTKIDSYLMNLINKKKVLQLIRHHKEISRSQLVKETKLTTPTITRIVDDLIVNDRIVKNIGFENSKAGRPSAIVGFNNKENFIIGIDLGATHIRGVLSDLEGSFLYEIQVPTEIEKGFEFIFENVIDIINKIRNRRGIDPDYIKGVGIGVAGLVNYKTGEVEFSPDFGWEGINLNLELKKRLDIPFFFDNSSRLMALGELEIGKFNNLTNFVVINIGYGIGAGFVLEGSVIKGYNGLAGELGHVLVDYKSTVQCKCGQYGCLEALASGHRIASLGEKLIQNKKSAILLELANANSGVVDAKIIALAAIKGDKECLKIYNEITEYLCIGIRDIVNILNPEAIFIGGGISFAGDFFFNLINEKIPAYLFKSKFKVPIYPATFGEHATLMGAISLVRNKILNFELEYQLNEEKV